MEREGKFSSVRPESVYKALACTVGLVDHRLDDSSPGVDKPDEAKERTGVKI